MSEEIEKIAGSLGSVVGHENVQYKPALRIDYHEPSVLVFPGSVAQAADSLRVCSEANLAVIPAGNMTWLDCGNILRRCDIVLSLRKMARIIDYSPPDLTITVEAGTMLGELNSAALAEGQWLPLDPPGHLHATVGAIVSCASSGPLRFGFGTPRDYVIGLRLAHMDGALSKSGGRVVKNVAGYDMNKLYAGSFGTLGVIAETTFKLRPRPDTFTTLVIEAKDHARLGRLAEAMLGEGLEPASSILASELSDAKKPDNRFSHTLFVRFIESEATVKHQVKRALELAGRDATVFAGPEQEQVWNDLIDLERFGNTIVRISSPVSKTRGLIEEIVASGSPRYAQADIATGIIRAALREDENKEDENKKNEAADWITGLRSKVSALGGTLFIERAAPHVRERAGAWSDAGASSGLMAAIKAKFDPQGLLNPGRFVEGI